MASAAFSVNGSVPTDAVAVAASSTVNLALTSTTGVRTVAWSVVGAHANVAYPTITPAGSPSGATASFAMPAGASQCYRIQCVINGGIEGTESVAAYTATALVGVVNAAGNVPFALGEELERDTGYGWVGALNLALSIAAGETEIGALVTALRAESGAEGQIRYLRGYSAAGDGAEGSFRWSDTAATDNGGTILNAGGVGSSSAGWRRVYSGPVNAAWFGLGGGVSPCTSIQRAIDFVLANNGESGYPVPTVRIPPGVWDLQVGEMLFLAKRDGAGPSLHYVSITLEGEQGSYGAGFRSACIRQLDPTLPAIATQATNRTTIRGLTITGANEWTLEYGGAGATTHYDSTWSGDPLFSAPYTRVGVRTNAKSPHCAIAIDAFHNTVAGGDQYTSADPTVSARLAECYAHNTSRATTDFRVENCNLNDFYLGIGNSLNGSTQNCEDVYIKDCFILGCAYAVANGQGQGRNVVLENTAIHGFHTALDGVTFGAQNGGNIGAVACNIGGGRYIVNSGVAGSAAVLSQITCESIMSVGQIGGGVANGETLKFEACQFTFFATPSGYPSYPRLLQIGQVLFDSCVFTHTDMGDETMFFATSNVHGQLAMENCSFTDAVSSTKPGFWMCSPATASLRAFACAMGNQAIDNFYRIQQYASLGSQKMLPGTLVQATDTDELYQLAPDYLRQTHGLASVTINADGTGTITGTGIETKAAVGDIFTMGAAGDFNQIYPFMGAYVATSGGRAVGRVASVGTGTVTLEHVMKDVPVGSWSLYAMFEKFPTWDTATKHRVVREDASGNVAVTGTVQAQSGGKFRSGSGTPEGAVTGAVGDFFARTNGSAGTTFYVKESGSGNTGWVPALTTGSTSASFSSFVGIGSPLPTTGGLRMANATYLVWDSAPTGTDINAFGVTSNENLIVGTSGTNGTNNTYYDVKTGGKHYFWVNTVEAATVDAAGLAVVGALSYEGGRVATASASGTATDGTEFTALEYTLPADCEADVTAVIKLHKSAVGKEIIVIAGDFETTSSTAAQLGTTDAVRHKPNTQAWSAAFAVSGAKVQVKLTLAADVVWSVSLQVVR